MKSRDIKPGWAILTLSNGRRIGGEAWEHDGAAIIYIQVHAHPKHIVQIDASLIEGACPCSQAEANAVDDHPTT